MIYTAARTACGSPHTEKKERFISRVPEISYQSIEQHTKRTSTNTQRILTQYCSNTVKDLKYSTLTCKRRRIGFCHRSLWEKKEAVNIRSAANITKLQYNFLKIEKSISRRTRNFEHAKQINYDKTRYDRQWDRAILQHLEGTIMLVVVY
jgi:hypothetical protein